MHDVAAAAGARGVRSVSRAKDGAAFARKNGSRRFHGAHQATARSCARSAWPPVAVDALLKATQTFLRSHAAPRGFVSTARARAAAAQAASGVSICRARSEARTAAPAEGAAPELQRRLPAATRQLGRGVAREAGDRVGCSAESAHLTLRGGVACAERGHQAAQLLQRSSVGGHRPCCGMGAGLKSGCIAALV